MVEMRELRVIDKTFTINENASHTMRNGGGGGDEHGPSETTSEGRGLRMKQGHRNTAAETGEQ